MSLKDYDTGIPVLKFDHLILLYFSLSIVLSYRFASSKS